jgi:hypothetical protein
MRGIFCFGLFAVLVLGCSSSEGDRSSSKKSERGKDDPAAVRFGELRSTAPASWEKETPKSSMRAYQFRVPRAKGDDEDAELLVFNSFRGSAEANIDRWKTKEFEPPEGKKIEDVSKVTQMNIASRPAHYLDVSGTYLGGPGMGPTRKPNYRMFGVHYEGADGKTYHIILRGPAATVAEHKKEFDDWLAGFR